MSNRAAEVTETYESLRSTFMDFIVALPVLNKNSYIQTVVEPSDDNTSATIRYLGESFQVRLSITSFSDRIFGIVCVYLHETDKDTPILRYFFDINGEIYDLKSGNSSKSGIYQNTFPKQLIDDLADAYLKEMGERHIK